MGWKKTNETYQHVCTTSTSACHVIRKIRLLCGGDIVMFKSSWSAGIIHVSSPSARVLVHL